jgi:hypothetical protein
MIEEESKSAFKRPEMRQQSKVFINDVAPWLPGEALLDGRLLERRTPERANRRENAPWHSNAGRRDQKSLGPGLKACSGQVFAIVRANHNPFTILGAGSMAGHEEDDLAHSGTGGTMDITDKIKTWNAFWNGAKWSAAGIAVIALLLFFFRTHNGY